MLSRFVSPPSRRALRVVSALAASRFSRPSNLASSSSLSLSSSSLSLSSSSTLFVAKRSFASSYSGPGKDIDASRLQVTLTDKASPLQKNEDLVFGQYFTDHMLEVDWDAENGWHDPVISPFHDLPMHPAASSLHYALQCFEGMKAYVDKDDTARLFRPDRNMARMNNSMERLLMPRFDGEQFLECIKELIRIDKRFIPREDGYSLYIRPTGISTHPWLGVGPPLKAKLFVILSPVGPYYKSGFAPVKLLADPHYVRAWPGGTGNRKVGGNYAMGIAPAKEAAERGFQQILWLFGDKQEVTEVGTMNQFFLWKRASDGKTELITAPLGDGTILPGVTRESILELTRQWGEFEVTERTYTIHEVVDAIKDGRMIESFGCGTAAIVSPVEGLHYDGVDYDIPIDADLRSGKLTNRLAQTIMDIQYGRVEHEWSVAID